MNQQIQQELNDYIEKLSVIVHEGAFITPIQSREETIKNWRKTANYSDELADSLILATKTYIRTMNKDFKYIQNFTTAVADYLAEYFAKSPKFESQFAAGAFLQDELSVCSETRYKRDLHLNSIKKKRRHEYHAQVRQQAAAEKKPGLVVGTTKDGAMYRRAQMANGTVTLIACGFKKNPGSLANTLMDRAKQKSL